MHAILLSRWVKETNVCGSIWQPFCLSALSLHFIATFMFSKVSVVQLWLQGYMHAHTNAVFGGKWLRCLCITLCCYCAVPPLISHSLSQLHMAQQVLPPTPCLSRSHSRTDYFTEYCVWSFQWEQKLNSVNAVTYGTILHGLFVWKLEMERDFLCRCAAK